MDITLGKNVITVTPGVITINGEMACEYCLGENRRGYAWEALFYCADREGLLMDRYDIDNEADDWDVLHDALGEDWERVYRNSGEGKPKHTPGRWKRLAGTYENGPQVKVVSCDKKNNMYIMVGGENREANVRLIASAPELLEVCQEIAALADGQGRLNMMEVAGHARQVISKTRGKS